MRAGVHPTAECFRTSTFSGRSRATPLENDTVLPLTGLLRQVPRCLAAYRSNATALRSASAACGSTGAALLRQFFDLLRPPSAQATSAAYRFTAAVLCFLLRPLNRGRSPLHFDRSRPTATAVAYRSTSAAHLQPLNVGVRTVFQSAVH